MKNPDNPRHQRIAGQMAEDEKFQVRMVEGARTPRQVEEQDTWAFTSRCPCHFYPIGRCHSVQAEPARRAVTR